MSTTSNIQVRVDTKLKKQAEKILDDIGLDMPSAFRVFLKKMVALRGFPFRLGEEVDENGFTKKQQRELDKAIKESYNPKKRIGPFDTMDEAIEYLNRKR